MPGLDGALSPPSRRGVLALGVTAALAGCRRSPDAAPPTGHGRSGGVTPDQDPTTTSVATAPPSQRIRAVAPDGDDRADGTTGAPWRTLGAALSRLRPGDELRVADGTYDEDVDVTARAGTAERLIRVRAAAGARPVLHGLLWLTSPTWWDVRGLNVTWAARGSSKQHMVKMQGGTDWVLAEAELWDARSYAALAVTEHPERFRLAELYVHDTHRSNGTNQDHLIYLNCGRGGGVVERCLLAHSPNGRAVKIGPAEEGGPTVSDIAVRRCTMVDNTGPSNVQLAYRVSDVTIERNILQGAAPGRANVTGFELHGARNVVRDNLCWDSSAPLEGHALSDGGGNLEQNPRLGPEGDPERPYLPGTALARRFGRWS